MITDTFFYRNVKKVRKSLTFVDVYLILYANNDLPTNISNATHAFSPQIVIYPATTAPLCSIVPLVFYPSSTREKRSLSKGCYDKNCHGHLQGINIVLKFRIYLKYR